MYLLGSCELLFKIINNERVEMRNSNRNNPFILGWGAFFNKQINITQSTTDRPSDRYQ